MAEAPRRKRLEKIEEEPKRNEQKYYCCRCGSSHSRQKGFFPVSHSPMYRGSGYLPMCSDCVDDLYEKYINELGSEKAAMRRVCMKLDLYWSDSIWASVERTAGLQSRVRNYIGKTNLVRFIDKNFDDTLEEEECIAPVQTKTVIDTPADEPEISDEPEEIEVIEVAQEVLDFWGPGYTPTMYLDLEQRRGYWMSRFPKNTEIDIGTEALIRQICNLEIDINRDRAAGKPIDKSVNALNTLLGSASLKPTQKTESDTGMENTPFGVWIHRWEDELPVPEVDPEFEDVDGIVRYFEIWFKGHLSKMLGLKNAASKLYEETIQKMRVERPEYDDEDDDEDVFNDIFQSDDDE